MACEIMIEVKNFFFDQYCKLLNMNVHKKIRNYLLPPPPLKRNVRTIKKIFVKIGSMLAEILLHLSYKKKSLLVLKESTPLPYTTAYYLTTNFTKELKERKKKLKKKNIEIYQ